MRLSDFDYSLPKELIAQCPSQKRDESRLLVLRRDTGRMEHRIFRDMAEYLNPGDLLVLNDTKVLPARLWGRKETGGKVEVLLLGLQVAGNRYRVKDEYEALLKPARGCNIGSRIIFKDGELEARVSRIENGRRFLRFNCNGGLEKILDTLGEMPLPPYIKRKAADIDRDRYQTVYADKGGAVAAPTAGLHFTKEVLSGISEKGVGVEYVTLHVGYGTFRPVKSDDVRQHRMEKEYFEIKAGVLDKIKNRKGRIIVVGTTSCRVLETEEIASPASLARNDLSTRHCDAKLKQSYNGWTDLFIYPGYKFRMVDALLTNFHLPKTTLLMLVSAFCGRELLMKAYEEAIRERYRFYSYGDAMLIL
ncbi:MAG: tRNA preQ1(34) S-adenosylmethionine ribosyltransferase-isomerase QueA [Candidatus Omnitrophota bacterium]